MVEECKGSADERGKPERTARAMLEEKTLELRETCAKHEVAIQQYEKEVELLQTRVQAAEDAAGVMQKGALDNAKVAVDLVRAKAEAALQKKLTERSARKLAELQKKYEDLEMQRLESSRPDVADPTDEDLAHNLHKLLCASSGEDSYVMELANPDSDHATTPGKQKIVKQQLIKAYKAF